MVIVVTIELDGAVHAVSMERYGARTSVSNPHHQPSQLLEVMCGSSVMAFGSSPTALGSGATLFGKRVVTFGLIDRECMSRLVWAVLRTGWADGARAMSAISATH